MHLVLQVRRLIAFAGYQAGSNDIIHMLTTTERYEPTAPEGSCRIVLLLLLFVFVCSFVRVYIIYSFLI